MMMGDMDVVAEEMDPKETDGELVVDHELKLVSVVSILQKALGVGYRAAQDRWKHYKRQNPVLRDLPTMKRHGVAAPAVGNFQQLVALLKNIKCPDKKADFLAENVGVFEDLFPSPVQSDTTIVGEDLVNWVQELESTAIVVSLEDGIATLLLRNGVYIDQLLEKLVEVFLVRLVSQRSTSSLGRNRYYFCRFHGRPTEHLEGYMDAGKKRGRPPFKCGCPVHLKTYISKSGNAGIIQYMYGHAHSLGLGVLQADEQLRRPGLERKAKAVTETLRGWVDTLQKATQNLPSTEPQISEKLAQIDELKRSLALVHRSVLTFATPSSPAHLPQDAHL
mmetsp:Transcript_765/g.4767  ORF Transcript_765/g.4767 Transcript_765/m.4767 type:complete len:334 (+) Transcript_765:124-1125(+)